MSHDDVTIKTNACLRVLKNSSTFFLGTKEKMFIETFLCRFIYLRPVSTKGVRTQRAFVAGGCFLLLGQHSLHIAEIQKIRFPQLVDRYGHLISFFTFFFLFLWNPSSWPSLFWFNSVNPYVFTCPWYHRRGCQTKTQTAIRRHNDVSDEIILDEQGPAWPSVHVFL